MRALDHNSNTRSVRYNTDGFLNMMLISIPNLGLKSNTPALHNIHTIKHLETFFKVKNSTQTPPFTSHFAKKNIAVTTLPLSLDNLISVPLHRGGGGLINQDQSRSPYEPVTDHQATRAAESIEHHPDLLSGILRKHNHISAGLLPPKGHDNSTDFNGSLVRPDPDRGDFNTLPSSPRQGDPLTVVFYCFHNLFLLSNKLILVKFLRDVTPKPHLAAISSPASTSSEAGSFFMSLLKNFSMKRVSQMQPTGGH